MIYSTPEFLILFAFCALWFALFAKQSARVVCLTVCSFAFYAWAGLSDTLIFATVILVSWSSVALSARYNKHKRLFIVTGVSVLAANLFFWKYLPWVSRELAGVLPQLIQPAASAALPVGVSFFTLQAIAYLIDFSRGQAPLMSFKEYALFKSFFPQLVAGPIVRCEELLPQLKKLRGPVGRDVLCGLSLFVLGLFKKVALADRVAPFVQGAFATPQEFSSLGLWVALLGYTVQIWADFSGYTDMGRGAARMLGVHLPENFLSPYLSRSPSEFWKRWHITLSSWIRDYIYIPLTSRFGRTSWLQVSFCLILTMSISGLWHGANWTFLIWGLYHGLLLAAERALKLLKIKSSFATQLGTFATFFSVVLGWMCFRATDLASLSQYFAGLFLSTGQKIYPASPNNVYFAIACASVLQIALYQPLTKKGVAGRSWFQNQVTRYESFLETPAGGYVVGAVLSLLFVFSLALRFPDHLARPFIYFQF